jgi:sugar O-acyltransferase (sialic acid O-acetyltransferase NeuD family)
MKNIYLLGGGGHGKAIIDMIISDLGLKIEAVFDDSSTETILGYEVIKIENKKFSTSDNFHISIGSNKVRKKISKKLNVNYPSLIHPTCIFSKFSSVDDGTVIMANTSVKAETTIGKHCIINAGAVIGHDIIIEDFVHVAPNASVAGFVNIKEGAHIGIGSSIIQGITIGKWAIIGAGAVIIKDVPDYAVVVGNPGVIKKYTKEKKTNLVPENFSNIEIQKKNNDFLLERKKTPNCNTEALSYKLDCFNLISKEDILKYKSFLENFKGFDVFYKPELFKIKNTETEQLKYFILRKEEQIIAIMPFSQRKIILDNKNTTYFDITSFYGYSGPLFINKISTDNINCFWNLVDNWYGKNKIVSEFIRFNLEGNYQNYSGKLTPTLNNVMGNILEDEDLQWNNFTSKVRNNYRKAISNGLESKIYYKNIDENIINIFHDIYIKTMDRNNAENNYYYSIEYFKTFIISNPENIAIAIIYKDEVPISTELILLNKNKMFSFLGGTNADFFSLRPNDFLKMEAIKWGRKQGYSNYILGGGRSNGDSLYKYKKSFFPNTDDVIYYTGRKIINTSAYEKLVTLANKYSYKISDQDITNEYFPLYRK